MEIGTAFDCNALVSWLIARDMGLHTELWLVPEELPLSRLVALEV